MNTGDFNLLSVLKLEKDRLEICTSNKDDIEYLLIMRWLVNRIRELEHDRNGLC